MDHAMVFSTGYQANLGIISTLAGKDDYIFLDIDSHASIYDGCALGNAQIVAVPPQRRRGARKAPQALPPEAPASWSSSKASIRCSATSRRSGRWSRWPRRHGAMVLVDEAHSMGFIGEQRPRRRRSAGRDRRCRLHHRHLLQVGRHGRRLLRLQPSQVRDPAAGLPPLRVHRLASAVGRRDRRDLDPQADGQRRQARPFVGEFASASTPACASSASSSAPTSRNRRSSRSSCPTSRPARRCGRRCSTRASTSISPARRPRPAGMTLLRCSLCAAAQRRAGRRNPRHVRCGRTCHGLHKLSESRRNLWLSPKG